jgi:hypothetical protein
MKKSEPKRKMKKSVQKEEKSERSRCREVVEPEE